MVNTTALTKVIMNVGNEKYASEKLSSECRGGGRGGGPGMKDEITWWSYRSLSDTCSAVALGAAYCQPENEASLVGTGVPNSIAEKLPWYYNNSVLDLPVISCYFWRFSGTPSRICVIL